VHGGSIGTTETPGAQAEAVHIPQADGTLFHLQTDRGNELKAIVTYFIRRGRHCHHAAVSAKVVPLGAKGKRKTGISGLPQWFPTLV
jgi:hypothetical protein